MVDLQQILFWVFSIWMLVAGALVITRDNLVNSAMLLIQVFLCMAGLFLLLQAFFLAVIQVLVYAGAVVVLFLFVIMLLRPEDADSTAFSSKANAGAIIAFAALCGIAMYTALNAPAPPPLAEGAAPTAGALRDVIQPVFSKYLLPFELTALILLAAMVGVVVMSKLDAANKAKAPNRLDAIDPTHAEHGPAVSAAVSSGAVSSGAVSSGAVFSAAASAPALGTSVALSAASNAPDEGLAHSAGEAAQS